MKDLVARRHALLLCPVAGRSRITLADHIDDGSVLPYRGGRLRPQPRG